MVPVAAAVPTKIKSRQILEFPTAWDESTTPYALNQFTPSARTLSDIASADKLSRLSSGSSSSGRNESSIPIRLGKAVFVGDVGVGKTSIINRFSRDIFQAQYSATIGVDYEIERFWILNIPYNLQIWDTAGQERFKCIASAYYRGANIIVTVFDASNLESLSTCQRWMDDAVGANRTTPLRFLVGTKIDLVNEAHQDKIHQMGLRMASLLGAEYWPVSSKTGENVEMFFRRISVLALETTLANEASENIAHSHALMQMHNTQSSLIHPSSTDWETESESRKCSSCKSI